MMRRLIRAFAAVAVALPVAAAAEDVIRPHDTLELKVARWDSATADMVPLAFLESELAVGGDGRVLMPVLGEVATHGVDRAALVERIGAGLGKALGITDPLYVSLSVASHGPVYVVGAVQNPGRFEYVPGITALQAIALAGGPLREQSFFSRTERDAVRSLGDRRLLLVERAAELASLARLEAEAAGRETVAMPTELAEAPNADELLSVEQEVLDARREEHQSALSAIDDLTNLLHQRIAKLAEEVTLREELLAATREEQANMESLVARGLSRQSQVNDVARTVAELEARRLQLETSILEAEQRLSEAERDRVELIGQRRVSIVTALQETRARLAGIASRMETAEALFAEAARFGATLDALRSEEGKVSPTLVVTRTNGGGDTEVRRIDDQTPLQPGDVLSVDAPDARSGVALRLSRGGLANTTATASIGE
jgi:protein involved in polysaccharide export with SLBB domain